MPLASYVRGADAPPLIEETIGSRFDAAARCWAGREALVALDRGIRWSYSELAERVDACAAGLLALGLHPGDRVGIWSPNCPEWVVTQFATAKAGMILTTVNPLYRTAELEHALRRSGCRALVLAKGFKGGDYPAMLQELTSAGRTPELKFVIPLDEFPELLRRGAGERARLDGLAGQLSARDPINIQFTSGTTGLPKGATLTHRNILNNALLSARTMGLGEGDRLCVPVPLYHCFGMVLSTLSCISVGATMVLPGEGFDPRAVLAAVETERCTHLHGVPTMFVAELEHPEFSRFDLSSLRGGIMAGAPCPIELMRRVVDRMHLGEITIGYGMTETGPLSFQSSTDDPLERRVSTVGRIHPHVEVKIVDAAGRTVPRGTAGELLTRGYSVMNGYWEDPEQTARAIDPDGWMHTGDLATLDEEGYCNIVGRIKDMVIRGGENIYPREIEEFLFIHPKIETVQVFGVPDPRYGEEVCAWIRVRAGETLGEDEVRAFCDGRIARFKIPRHIQFVQDFPMTVTGKIQKFEMRRAMMERLGRHALPTA